MTIVSRECSRKNFFDLINLSICIHQAINIGINSPQCLRQSHVYIYHYLDIRHSICLKSL
jgi:hypothetical protein